VKIIDRKAFAKLAGDAAKPARARPKRSSK
jgi:hypothetical protein